MILRSNLAWAFVLGCAGMAVLAGSLAAADANPYEVIIDRNIFHLNPIPDPPPPPPPKPPDLPKVMLTGFVGKGHSMKILLAIVPKDTKQPIYYTSLYLGQKDHDVELVSIHADKEAVDIVNAGEQETLTVASNSYDALAPATASASAERTGAGRPRMMPPGIGLPPGMMTFRHQPRG